MSERPCAIQFESYRALAWIVRGRGRRGGCRSESRRFRSPLRSAGLGADGFDPTVAGAPQRGAAPTPAVSQPSNATTMGVVRRRRCADVSCLPGCVSVRATFRSTAGILGHGCRRAGHVVGRNRTQRGPRLIDPRTRSTFRYRAPRLRHDRPQRSPRAHWLHRRSWRAWRRPKLEPAPIYRAWTVPVAPNCVSGEPRVVVLFLGERGGTPSWFVDGCWYA